MNEKLKDIFYSDSFIRGLADSLHEEYPAFDRQHFQKLVFSPDWPEMALKEKMRHLTICLHAALPGDYHAALAVLRAVAPHFPNFEAMSFSDYAACYGLDDPQASLPALHFFTQFMSAEFAIRPFLAHDPQGTLGYVYQWAEDENADVRRLASEGTRPRLPWAMALPAFKKDPAPILPILEKLRADPSESVRRSVANNLNDIAKDHPELVLDICMRWQGESPEVDWVVKHACRTLLKRGDPRAMRLFGFADPAAVYVENLTLLPQTLAIGDDLQMSFDLLVETAEPCQVRLEYAIDFVKARGQTSRKVFFIKETTLPPGNHPTQRKHSFSDRSTRKHYPGDHQVTLLINGVEKASGTVLVSGD